MVTSGCIFTEDANNENNTNNENNAKDMQSGDMTKMDMPSTSDMDTSDMVNPSDASADSTEPTDMGPDIEPPKDMEPDLDPPDDGALFVFLTAKKVNLFNGLNEADGACNVDSNKPNAGMYKAMLGDPTRRPCLGSMECSDKPEGYNWVLQPNQLYQRYDLANDVAVPVFKTNDKAKFGEMLAQIRPGPGINFATGFEKTWKVAPAQLRPADCLDGCRTTCGGWTKRADIGKQMAVGWTETKVAAGFLEGGKEDCGSNLVLCVEQPRRPTTGN